MLFLLVSYLIVLSLSIETFNIHNVAPGDYIPSNSVLIVNTPSINLKATLKHDLYIAPQSQSLSYLHQQWMQAPARGPTVTAIDGILFHHHLGVSLPILSIFNPKSISLTTHHPPRQTPQDDATTVSDEIQDIPRITFNYNPDTDHALHPFTIPVPYATGMEMECTDCYGWIEPAFITNFQGDDNDNDNDNQNPSANVDLGINAKVNVLANLVGNYTGSGELVVPLYALHPVSFAFHVPLLGDIIVDIGADLDLLIDASFHMENLNVSFNTGFEGTLVWSVDTHHSEDVDSVASTDNNKVFFKLISVSVDDFDINIAVSLRLSLKLEMSDIVNLEAHVIPRIESDLSISPSTPCGGLCPFVQTQWGLTSDLSMSPVTIGSMVMDFNGQLPSHWMWSLVHLTPIPRASGCMCHAQMCA